MIRRGEWGVGALALSIALTGAVTAAVHTGPRPVALDSLVAERPTTDPSPIVTAVPLPSPASTPTVLPVPSLPAVPTTPPTVSVPPLPLPSVSLPALPCEDMRGVTRWSKPTTRIPQSGPGRDARYIGSESGRVWYVSSPRDSSNTEHLVGVPVAGGAATVLTVANEHSGYLLDHGYLYAPETYGIRRISIDGTLTTAPLTTPSGEKAAVLDIAETPGHVVATVIDGQGTDVVSVDTSTMKQEWMTPLSHQDGVQGGSGIGIARHGDDTWVVAGVGTGLVRDGLRAWHFDARGTELKEVDLANDNTANFSLTLAATAAGPVLSQGWPEHARHTNLERLSPTSLQPAARWTSPGLVEELKVVNGEIWTNAITCGNPFVLTRLDPTSLSVIGTPQELDDECYGVDAMDGSAWMLVTKSPAEPVAIDGLRL